ncbi:PLD nuclease N-terminal domain-containing protein [Umezawaea sp.]|uniref:PLD nuclease N-terminal domain-containing protein n=1 Tax=Umezawaea sp. TaxID=1955258 RepID=UPI002ED2829A
MLNDHHVLAVQAEPWNWAVAAVIVAVVLGLVVLFLGALVSVLRSGLTLGMKAVWVVFAFCAPFLGPVLWFLIGREDLDARRVHA